MAAVWMVDKMSTTSDVFTARINTSVRISLTGLSFVNHKPTHDEASTTFSRFESRPTVQPTGHHRSLTLLVHPPVSSMSAGQLYISNGGQSSTSMIAAGHDHHHSTGDLYLHDNLNTSVFVRRRHAPNPPRLPGYMETEPPPPYNPDFLAPMSCYRCLHAVGRRWSACCQPPTPPPSRWSSSAAEVRSRSSLPLVSEQCLLDNSVNDDADDNDDVFCNEKPTNLGHFPEICS